MRDQEHEPGMHMKPRARERAESKGNEYVKICSSGGGLENAIQAYIIQKTSRPKTGIWKTHCNRVMAENEGRRGV
jgi:hypothetical protein